MTTDWRVVHPNISANLVAVHAPSDSNRHLADLEFAVLPIKLETYCETLVESLGIEPSKVAV